MASPSIACLGVIGKNNNPLAISIFPSYNPLPLDGVTFLEPIRTPLQFSLLLSSSLDVFEARLKQGTVLAGDFGLLHAVDDRISVYGYETNTGVKLVVVVDMMGRKEEVKSDDDGLRKKAAGVREAEVKVVFRAMQVAYVQLLQNPFYEPDEHSPAVGRGGKKITSKKFAQDLKRIGENWAPGVTNL